MSLRDKIRDGLYGSDTPDPDVDEQAKGLEDLMDETDDAQTLKTLVISLIIEAAAGAFVFFWPHTVLNMGTDGKVWMSLIVLPFGLGFIIGLTAYKLLRPRVMPPDPQIDGVFSKYADDLKSEREFTPWFIAAGAGALNLVLLYGLLVAVS